MKTRTAIIKLGLGTLAFGFCVAAQADSPFGINVLNSQCSTYVFVQTNGFNAGVDIGSSGLFQVWSPGNSRMTVSSVPSSDSMYLDGTGILAGEANVDTFGVSAYTDMHGAFGAGWPGHNSTAGAESEIWFSPTTSGTANIELDFSAAYNWEYSAGSVSLIDITSSQTLWNYGWYLLSGTVPWSGPYGGSGIATLTLETDLNATDSYALDMYTQAFSDSDAEQVSIQLSGLDVVPETITFVPEPSVFVLAGLGVTFLLTLNRRATQISANKAAL
jgi:hypothetical protein